MTESPVIPAFLHCEKICPQVTICRKAKFLPFVTQTSLFSNFYLSSAWLQSTALFCPMNFCRHISANIITCWLLIDLTIQENFYPDKEAEKCSCDLPCHTATVANRRHCWEKHPDLQSIYSSDPDKKHFWFIFWFSAAAVRRRAVATGTRPRRTPSSATGNNLSLSKQKWLI